MTDPFQPVDLQTQTPVTSQPMPDDILGGEDIFATIPEATPTDDDLPYGDVLEKKYQFEPIPEVEIPTQQAPIPQVAPVTAPIVQPTIQSVPVAQPQVSQPVVEQVQPTIQPTIQPVSPVVQPVSEPKESVIEKISQQEIQDIEKKSTLEQSQIENLLDTKLQTDVQKKFGELFFTTKKIYELKNVEDGFDILGADNDKIFISYKFLLDETSNPMLFITKIEQDKSTEDETNNELRFEFNEETSSLEVTINDTLLFDEINDFTEDQKKKMQVMDKLNKFIFLASEELRKIEKEIKARQEAELERKRLQEIFRNF